MVFCIIVMLRRSCSLTPFLGSSTYWIFMLDGPSPKGDLCLYLVSNQRPFARKVKIQKGKNAGCSRSNLLKFIRSLHNISKLKNSVPVIWLNAVTFKMINHRQVKGHLLKCFDMSPDQACCFPKGSAAGNQKPTFICSSYCWTLKIDGSMWMKCQNRCGVPRSVLYSACIAFCHSDLSSFPSQSVSLALLNFV